MLKLTRSPRQEAQWNLRLPGSIPPTASSCTIGGAAINACFTDYFNRIALYHFGIRKLERLYGERVVETTYREELEAFSAAMSR